MFMEDIEGFLKCLLFYKVGSGMYFEVVKYDLVLLVFDEIFCCLGFRKFLLFIGWFIVFDIFRVVLGIFVLLI